MQPKIRNRKVIENFYQFSLWLEFGLLMLWLQILLSAYFNLIALAD